jgi:hypothetical protein
LWFPDRIPGFPPYVLLLASQPNDFRPIEFEIRDTEYGVLVLALNRLVSPLPPLGLHLDAQRLAFGPCDGGPALEQALVDVGTSLEGVVPGAQRRGAVQAQHVAREDARHLERQADLVARLNKVRPAPDVCRDIVARLRAQQRQELGYRLGGLGRQGPGGLRLLGVQRPRGRSVRRLRLRRARLRGGWLLWAGGGLEDCVAGYRVRRRLRLGMILPHTAGTRQGALGLDRQEKGRR